MMFKIIDPEKNRAWWCFTPRGLRRQVSHLADEREGSLAENWAQTAKAGDHFKAGACTIEMVEVV